MKHKQKKSFKNLISRSGNGILGLGLFKKKISTLEEKLSQIPLFQTLNTNELREISSIVHKRFYNEGEYICYQNDPGLGMYIIEQGEAKVFLMGNNFSNEIATIQTGGCFGELSLLDDSPRSASVITTMNSNIIGFFRHDLEELLNKNSNLGSKILMRLAQLVSERLRQTNSEVDKLTKEIEKLSFKKKNNIK
ncbi:MAG: cyclic nucleotide-binding domain-containing protein [Bacteroidetes bacterium]|nr:cyclic nucleotide-binding domain-containing protein [Bacteroidota bacterium]